MNNDEEFDSHPMSPFYGTDSPQPPTIASPQTIQAVAETSGESDTPLTDVIDYDLQCSPFQKFRRMSIHARQLERQLAALTAKVAELEKIVAEYKEQTGCPFCRRAGSPRIYTKCPACQNDTLTINDDKHLLCTWIDCPDPTLIDRAAINKAREAV